jgi:hypothetical protein
MTGIKTELCVMPKRLQAAEKRAVVSLFAEQESFAQ